jgi:tetratricopeptide (TPR) repeat protein
VATVLLNLESSVAQQGHPREALALLQRALAIYEAQLGPDHPITARCNNNIGAVLLELGQYRAALDPLARALAAKEKALGPESPELSGTVLNLGEVHLALGDPGRGLPLVRRAVALDARLPETLDAHYALLALARGEREAGDRRAALAGLDRALAVARRHGGPDHPFVADTLEEQATLARRSGQPQQALALAREALAVDVRGKAAPQQLARDELAVAEALLALGWTGEAVPLLDGALGRLAGLSTAPSQEAAIRFALARARRLAGAPEPARAQAEAARALLAAAEGRDLQLRQQIEAWLAAGR